MFLLYSGFRKSQAGEEKKTELRPGFEREIAKILLLYYLLRIFAPVIMVETIKTTPPVPIKPEATG